MRQRAYVLIRKLLFPGFDIHTRSRAYFCRYWNFDGKEVLDAGCGNGYFSGLALISGARRCLGVSFDDDNTRKARNHFVTEVRSGRLMFETLNLYDLSKRFADCSFDAVICYETIEHLMWDQDVITMLFRLLRPGGVLHVCAPNKNHPENASITPSTTEDGWHVRHGYDEESLSALCTRAGLVVERLDYVGNRFTCFADHVVRTVRNRFGHVAALPFFVVFWPLARIAGFKAAADRGISIYATAIRPVS